MTVRQIAILLGAITVVSSCASGETVYLKKVATGQVAKCGPFTRVTIIPVAKGQEGAELRDCVTYYQRQGYAPTPGAGG